jgi:deoxyribodipyrimidine photo-lyase
MQELQNNFTNDQELDEYLDKTFQFKKHKFNNKVSFSQKDLSDKLTILNPIAYPNTRNYLDKKSSEISHYIRHGIISTSQISQYIIKKYGKNNSQKYLQELYWRCFWQVFYYHNPNTAWQNIEGYKTGYQHSDYADNLPDDVYLAQTKNEIINIFIQELYETGYLHNHTRMYLASYLIHFRKIKWQIGAKWFLQHLIDADIAVNNLSFQWIASCFSSKPYIFNLENIIKYAGKKYNIKASNNPELDFTYQELNKKLFPNL